LRPRNTTLHDIAVYHSISYLCWLKLAVLRVYLTLYFHLSVADAGYVSHRDYAFNLESAIVIGNTAISLRRGRSHTSISSSMPIFVFDKDSGQRANLALGSQESLALGLAPWRCLKQCSCCVCHFLARPNIRLGNFGSRGWRYLCPFWHE